MSVITKEIEILVDGRMIKYYEDLGYDVPKHYNKYTSTFYVKKGTRITVKVDDLCKNSHVKIKVKCDCCGNEK